MEAYSMRERRRIIELYEAGYETAEVAEMLGASASGVRRVRQHYRDEGRLTPKPHGGGPPPVLDVQKRNKVLLELLAKRPDAFTRELAEDFSDQTGVRVCRQTIGRWLEELGVTRKKSRCTPASRNVRMSPSAVRDGSENSPRPAAGTSPASAS